MLWVQVRASIPAECIEDDVDKVFTSEGVAVGAPMKAEVETSGSSNDDFIRRASHCELPPGDGGG